jgi:hypothetical protein
MYSGISTLVTTVNRAASELKKEMMAFHFQHLAIERTGR